MSTSPDPAAVAEAARILRAGGVVAFPTETVYGLGADAANAAAVRRVFAIKGRPADHPLIVHLAEAGWLGRWARAPTPSPRSTRTAVACRRSSQALSLGASCGSFSHSSTSAAPREAASKPSAPVPEKDIA